MIQIVANNRGQTSVEYLLLLGATFIATYIMITGPLSNFTQITILQIRSALGNVVRNGEMKPGEVAQPGDPGHPSDPKRLRPVHFGG